MNMHHSRPFQAVFVWNQVSAQLYWSEALNHCCGASSLACCWRLEFCTLNRHKIVTLGQSWNPSYAFFQGQPTLLWWPQSASKSSFIGRWRDKRDIKKFPDMWVVCHRPQVGHCSYGCHSVPGWTLVVKYLLVVECTVGMAMFIVAVAVLLAWELYPLPKKWRREDTPVQSWSTQQYII